MNSRFRAPAFVLICLSGTRVEMRAQAAPGQVLHANGQAALHRIIQPAHDPDLRWPDFPPYQLR